MANAAKKITYGPGELELAQVAHAVSVDPTREYLKDLVVDSKNNLATFVKVPELEP